MDLPFIDEHTTVVPAPADATWTAARDVLNVPLRGLGLRYARLIQVRGDRVFTLEDAQPPVRLGLTGRHRFSRYALTVTLRAVDPHRTEVTARTDAEFPGAAGRVYRALVIDSRAHVLAMRFVLRRIARRTVASAS